jgi:hypothetical protein
MASPDLLLSVSSGHYIHVGVINVSVTNLLIVLAMIVVFVLALVLPFPGAGDLGPDRGEQS